MVPMDVMSAYSPGLQAPACCCMRKAPATLSRHRRQRALGSAMSCGRKFSASVVNAATANRNSRGRYTCARRSALSQITVWE